MPLNKLAAALRSDDCSMTELPDGTAVLMDLGSESVLTLNETAACMLASAREGLDEEAIVARVVERYDVDEATARADLSEFLRSLANSLAIK